MPEKTSRIKALCSLVAFGLVACVLYGVGAGLRGDIGILLNPLAAHSGLSYADVSICIAVMQLVFGATQPFFGLLASRTSNRCVLGFGALFLGTSLLGMLVAKSFAALMLSLGVLFGIGAGALAFGLVLTSSVNFVGRRNAMIISGMLNAAAGMVGFVLAPVLQGLLSAHGLTVTLVSMSGLAAVLIPIIFFVTARDRCPKDGISTTTAEPLGWRVFREAFANRTFRLLFAGFSTCGFHMVIIESHLFTQFTMYGLSERSASWAFSVYGIATIIGALLSGFLSLRLHKGRLLGFYYGFRAVWVLLYLFVLPKNLFTAVLFATGLGMTGDATVSPTAGLVGENFSLGKVATVLGVLFLIHQVGAFMSAGLGGVIHDACGGYTPVWMINVALCLFASTMSFLIREEKKNTI